MLVNPLETQNLDARIDQCRHLFSTQYRENMYLRFSSDLKRRLQNYQKICFFGTTWMLMLSSGSNLQSHIDVFPSRQGCLAQVAGICFLGVKQLPLSSLHKETANNIVPTRNISDFHGKAFFSQTRKRIFHGTRHNMCHCQFLTAVVM